MRHIEVTFDDTAGVYEGWIVSECSENYTWACAEDTFDAALQMVIKYAKTLDMVEA